MKTVSLQEKQHNHFHIRYVHNIAIRSEHLYWQRKGFSRNSTEKVMAMYIEFWGRVRTKVGVSETFDIRT